MSRSRASLMYDSRYCFFSADRIGKFSPIPAHGFAASEDKVKKAGTFVFLQATDLFEERLQVHVEPVAVAEQLQEVPRANRTARVVDELAGRGQTIGEDFKLLPLEERANTSTSEELWSRLCAPPPFLYLGAETKHCFYNYDGSLGSRGGD